MNKKFAECCCIVAGILLQNGSIRGLPWLGAWTFHDFMLLSIEISNFEMNIFKKFHGITCWILANQGPSIHTVSASIRRRRLIKKSRVWGGGLLKYEWNFSNFCSKKPQKLDFWAKKWRFIWILINFSNGGGLIKSGVL